MAVITGFITNADQKEDEGTSKEDEKVLVSIVAFVAVSFVAYDTNVAKKELPKEAQANFAISADENVSEVVSDEAKEHMKDTTFVKKETEGTEWRVYSYINKEVHKQLKVALLVPKEIAKKSILASSEKDQAKDAVNTTVQQSRQAMKVSSLAHCSEQKNCLVLRDKNSTEDSSITTSDHSNQATYTKQVLDFD